MDFPLESTSRKMTSNVPGTGPIVTSLSRVSLGVSGDRQSSRSIVLFFLYKRNFLKKKKIEKLWSSIFLFRSIRDLARKIGNGRGWRRGSSMERGPHGGNWNQRGRRRGSSAECGPHGGNWNQGGRARRLGGIRFEIEKPGPFSIAENRTWTGTPGRGNITKDRIVIWTIDTWQERSDCSRGQMQ